LPPLVSASTKGGDFAGRLAHISHKRRKGIRTLLQNAIDRGELKPDTNIEWVIDSLSATFYLRHLVTGTSMFEEGLVEWIVHTVLNQIKTPAKATRRKKTA